MPKLISSLRLLCWIIGDSVGTSGPGSVWGPGSGSSSDSSCSDSSDSPLAVESSVSETVDLFDRFLGILMGSEESDSGSDFTFISLLFLLFRSFVALPVPCFVVLSGPFPSGSTLFRTPFPVEGWVFDEFFFSLLRAPKLLTDALIAFLYFFRRKRFLAFPVLNRGESHLDLVAKGLWVDVP